jgi:hypothetical protein
MRLAALVPALLLSGCFLLPGSSEDSRVEDVRPELKRTRLVLPSVPDRFPYGDPAKVAAGAWARYRIGERTLTLAVVGKEGDAAWVEEIEEGEPRQVKAQLVAPDGRVLKAFYGEVARDGARTAVEPVPLDQAEPQGRLEWGTAKSPERVKVGARELEATPVFKRTVDLEGRILEEVSHWSQAVPPLYASHAAGGLVRLRSPKGEAVLEDFGGDARPLLPVK